MLFINNHNPEKTGLSSDFIVRASLFKETLNNEYVYLGEKPDYFPKGKRFSKGIYFIYDMDKTSAPERFIVKDDGLVYNAPYVEIILKDESNVIKRFKSYDKAERYYKKLCSFAKLFTV